MTEQKIDYEQAEALGISHEAYDEVLDIVGRIPTIEELSTLLAMWESNGKQQSLYGWLRGQRHTVERDEYLYSGKADHKSIREPKVKECVEIGHSLCKGLTFGTESPAFSTGTLLYMVGNVSTEFADSEYSRRCLHLVEEPMATGGHDEDCQYIEMILAALQNSGLTTAGTSIGKGGLFGSLLRLTAPLGYDILSPREVRLDAFLFGEEPGRYLVAVADSQDDTFLLKLGEARLNCCFLGRTTKNRLMVDGYDFGPVAEYTTISR
ncbi:MAG: hypothetical protein IKJ78_07205 [Bacteroidales bacterium]|nr:hypothetical protein [Bacteroidales bacterium]